jgi:two-component system invasion response regulator UvrY
MLRILVADDHPIFRQGVIRIISSTPDIVVAGEASNGQDALNKISENDYDLVLLDISMPHKTGIEVIRELRSIKPKLKVLVLTIYPEKQYALRVLKAGASGYLTKERAPDELIQALRTVASGGKYIPSSIAESVVMDWSKTVESPPHEILSNREYQIMRMIVSGQKVGEIAKDLSISVKTVKTHRSRILAKMKMNGNTELIHYAIKNGLVSDISPDN